MIDGIPLLTSNLSWRKQNATGFNSTLRQGNVTHHEYIQVWYASAFFSFISMFNFRLFDTVLFRLEKEGMLAWTRLPCLKGKLLVEMGSKFLVGTFTDLDNFLTSLGCFLSSSQLLVSMFALWYVLNCSHDAFVNNLTRHLSFWNFPDGNLY